MKSPRRLRQTISYHGKLPMTTDGSLLAKRASPWCAGRVPGFICFDMLFSLAPLVLIVIAVAGLVFGEDAARGQIEAQLRALMGNGGARASVGGLHVRVRRWWL